MLHFYGILLEEAAFHQQLNPSPSFRYSLTDDGLVLAERLDSEHAKQASAEVARDDAKDGPGVVDLTASDDEDEAQTSSEADGLTNKGESSRGISGKPDADRLSPGSYEIILCVDVIETTG